MKHLSTRHALNYAADPKRRILSSIVLSNAMTTTVVPACCYPARRRYRATSWSLRRRGCGHLTSQSEQAMHLVLVPSGTALSQLSKNLITDERLYELNFSASILRQNTWPKQICELNDSPPVSISSSPATFRCRVERVSSAGSSEKLCRGVCFTAKSRNSSINQ